MGDDRKNWLILAHCFNMDGRAASQTITDRLPYLMEKGIIPFVVSAPTGTKDKAFPHFRVFSPAPSGLLFELRQVITSTVSSRLWAALIKALLTVTLFPFYLVEKLVIHLDSHWSWFITAVIKARRVISRNEPVLIYSTAGPSSTHVAGYILSYLFKIPWVAELHDPLVQEGQKQGFQRSIFNRWLEKTIFSNAARVIYFTHTALNHARERTGFHDRGVVLRPGARLPDMDPVVYTRGEIFHFGHFGSLARDRNMGTFLKGLHLFFDRHPETMTTIQVDLFGGPPDEETVKWIRNLGLESVVKPHGRLEYDSGSGKSGRQQVIELMFLADVLVLVHGESSACETYIPSKVYEYLQTGRPILGIAGKETELGKILMDSGHRVVDGQDVDGIARVIGDFFKAWNDHLPVTLERNNRFSVADTVDRLLLLVENMGRPK